MPATDCRQVCHAIRLLASGRALQQDDDGAWRVRAPRAAARRRAAACSLARAPLARGGASHPR
eukprot:270760-Prymnesium_polylepis.1